MPSVINVISRFSTNNQSLLIQRVGGPTDLRFTTINQNRWCRNAGRDCQIRISKYHSLRNLWWHGLDMSFVIAMMMIISYICASVNLFHRRLKYRLAFGSEEKSLVFRGWFAGTRIRLAISSKNNTIHLSIRRQYSWYHSSTTEVIEAPRTMCLAGFRKAHAFSALVDFSVGLRIFEASWNQSVHHLKMETSAIRSPTRFQWARSRYRRRLLS